MTIPALHRVALPVGLLALAPLVAVLVILANGSVATSSELSGPSDVGMLTTLGLPVSRALRDLGAATCIGALVLVATVLPTPTPGAAVRTSASRARGLAIAAVAGSVWVWSTVATVVFTYGTVAEVDPFTPDGMQYFGSFVGAFEVARALLLSATLAAVAAIGSMAARRTSTVGVLALFAVAALWPLANTGHAAGDSNHDTVVSVQMAHLVGVSLWVGGLISLLLVRRTVSIEQFPVVARRFSSLAAWGAGLVLVSGVLAALQRVGSVSDLGTDYGKLLVVKGAALTLLVLAGWWHRRRVLPRLGRTPPSARHFRDLAVGEVVIMAGTIGVAVALSSTAPPAGGEATTPAESLLGHPMPPPLTVSTFFTEWRVDMVWASVALLGVTGYLLGARRLRRRGDRRPVGRSVAWVLGCLLLLWATSGSPGAYGRVLFSMHMLQHMSVAIAAPALLVLGAPVSLALRALTARGDGSRGPREWLLILVHSRLLALLAHPIVAAGMWVGSLVIFYSTSLFEASLRSHTVHLAMILHFLLSGYLLSSAVCGLDPGPRRVQHPFRVIILMMTFGAHALFNVSLMGQTRVLAESWFRALDRPWGNSPLRDQYIGAQLGWVSGDYPLVILGGALIWSWVRSDMRQAKRFDRQADRDADLELRRYNEYLARLHDGRP